MLMFEVLKKYNLLDDVESVDRFGSGNLNRTYYVKAKDNNNYILQMIDKDIYKKPEKVIENIDSIIKYSSNLCGKDKLPFNIELRVNIENNKFALVDGIYWRCLKLLPNTQILKKIINIKLVYELGKFIGQFHRSLRDFPAKNLNYTIPDLHNTLIYYKKLEYHVYEGKLEKVVSLFNETQFALNRKNNVNILNDALDKKEIPLRVVHNNLRLNNFLINSDTYDIMALIGYDAIMPGTLLYDFGCAVRYFTSTTKEDEGNLNFVRINIEFFKEFVTGYLEQTIDFITDKELDLLVDSVKLMSLESGIRHLNDYIEGNVTFKVDYKEQNLDKAKNLFKLVEDVENHYDGMKQVVINIRDKILKN